MHLKSAFGPQAENNFYAKWLKATKVSALSPAFGGSGITALFLGTINFIKIVKADYYYDGRGN